jgi:hypothetical protein
MMKYAIQWEWRKRMKECGVGERVEEDGKWIISIGGGGVREQKCFI